jgi:multicomponent Na+:H+ antiporter subunit A
MRFSGVLGDFPLWNALLISVGLSTALIGAFASLRRYDLKSMLAYSTVSQLGLLVAVIGIGTPEALVAAAVHTVAHALFKSALFLLTGIIDHQTGTRDIRILGRLHTVMPATTVLFGVAALSMAGVPPLLGFMSKEGIFDAFLQAPGPAWVGTVVASVGVLAAVLTFAYSSKMVLGIVGGATIDKPIREAAPVYLFPVALPALAGVLMGVWVAPIDRLAYTAGADASGVTVDGHLALWHGLNAPLLMSALVIVAGTGLALARVHVDRIVGPLASPISALRVVDNIRVAIIRMGDRLGDVTRTDSPNRHLAIPIVSLIVIASIAAATLTDFPAIVGDPTRAFDWALVGLLLVGVVGAITARSRVAAIAIIGIVGFGVTLWFLTLGATDVALTQLLVEVLTVVVMVLLLRRLPSTFRKASKRRAAGAGLVAICAGAAATAAVLAFTGRRDMSAAGEYFLREAPKETGGTNVVNTILVDFRALDTLGEITVLAIAGVAVLVLVQSRTILATKPVRLIVAHDSPLRRERDNAVFLRTLGRLVGPLTVVLSVFFLLRGHNAPGGGFIAALIGGAGVALAYLSSDSDSAARSRLPALALIGGGVALAVTTGLVGFAKQSFLKPLHFDVLSVPVSTAVIFDVGVYLVVIGVVVAALNLLGTPARSLDATPGTDLDSAEAAKERVS